MKSLMEWLLGLDSIRWGQDSPLTLQWQLHPPAWLLFGLSLCVIAAVLLMYSRERLSRGRRIVLMVLRCALLFCVAALLCGPMLVLERNQTEPSYVALLVDASLSMTRAEPYPDASLAQWAAEGAQLSDVASVPQHSRLDLVRMALLAKDAEPIRTLLRKNGVQLYSFSTAAQPEFFARDATSTAAAIERLSAMQANGAGTDLAKALIQAVEGAQGRRLAAIVLASDGQPTQPTSLHDALDLARGRQIPVYPIRLGSPTAPPDVQIERLHAEESVFLYDLIALEATIVASGAAPTDNLVLKVIDDQTGAEAASVAFLLTGDPPRETVSARIKPDRVGRIRYRVEVSTTAGEDETQNNVDIVDILVRDSRLNILYVDGYPRYEYRYVKNALLREPTMHLSALLLEADDQFVQEGVDPIRRFPETPEELRRFDVVLFGDVDPRESWLAPSQMNMLLDFVGNEGGGFGVIAGERTPLHRYLGTPLEKLLAARIDPEFLGRYESDLTSGFRPTLTREGVFSGLLRRAAASGAGAQSPSAGARPDADRIFEDLPELYWIARTLGPKPGAAVLLEHPSLTTRPDRSQDVQPLPILLTGRYGAGRILFQATDDTWRWRRHRIHAAPAGELLHDTYWVQAIRLLARSDAGESQRRYSLRTDRKSYEYGQRVVCSLEISDTRLLARLGETVVFRIEELLGAAEKKDLSKPVNDATFTSQRLEARRRTPGFHVFEATFTPENPGRFLLQAEGLSVTAEEAAPTAAFRVEQPDLEFRRPEANHELLDQIAAATGGAVVGLHELTTQFSQIRDRSVQIPSDVTEPLWDSRLSFILLCFLISVEWTLRKLFGLV